MQLRGSTLEKQLHESFRLAKKRLIVRDVNRRNGMRNSYPVPRMSESTSCSALPSSKTTEVLLKYAIRGLGTTFAPGVGSFRGVRDWYA